MPRAAVHRPIAATLVALLALVWGIVLAVNGVLGLLGDASVYTVLQSFVFAGVALLIAVGSFRVERWGWVLFMTWATWALTINLLRVFFFDHPQYLPLAVGTVTVFLLTPLDVQVTFGVRNPPQVRLGDSRRRPVDRV